MEKIVTMVMWVAGGVASLDRLVRMLGEAAKTIAVLAWLAAVAAGALWACWPA